MSASRIEKYRFGEIVIDGLAYSHDVIVFEDRVMGDWWRVEGHSLAVEDLRPVLEAHPRVLIVGQGAFSRMQVPVETRRRLEEAGILLVTLPTSEAVEAFNRMEHEGGVVAALHVTC